MKLPILFAFVSLTGIVLAQQPEDKSVEDIWDNVSPSIVYIAARGVDGSAKQGSGFVVTLEGKRLILTNRHVVQGAEEVSVGSEPKALSVASSYKIATDLDLAVVECPSTLTVAPIPLAQREPKPGIEVLALGFPLGLGKVITRGIVSGVEEDYFLFDAAISSGNSGGPVVNKAGEAIGVATMGSGVRAGVVIQNLNVDIRVGAIPRLNLFSDPLLRISAVADRIRETERFIADGFRRHEFLALHELLMFDWMMESMKRGEPREWAEMKKSEDARKGAEEYQQKRRVWEEKHGPFRNGLKTWIAFLKECEERISAIPSAFSGLGVDPVLADFLKDERRGGWVRVNARPELLPTLAKIGTDHWLAHVEDLRYRLEWIDAYWTDPVGIPLIPELEGRETLLGGERPSIRLQFSLTGSREKDLDQYVRTMAKWGSRLEVVKDSSAALHGGKNATLDPVRNETLHGDFLGQICHLWQYLAIEAAELGKIDEAINLLRRDMRGEAPSCWSGALLAQHLVFAGRIDDAWKAYEQHFQGAPPFDSVELKEGWAKNGVPEPAHWQVSDGMNLEGEMFKKQFGHLPVVLARVREWNVAVKTVDGTSLQKLTTIDKIFANKWFRDLPEFGKLRVLLYYKYVRPTEEDMAHYERTGKFQKRDTLKDDKVFKDAISGSPAAAAIWAKAFGSREIGFPF